MSDNISPLPFMDVIVDYAFKRVFGSVQNKKILIALLNSFLSEYVGEITDLEMISLNFLDYHDSGIMGKDCFVQRVTLKNDKNEIFFEKIMFFFVDLSKFADGKNAVDFSDERQKWAYYIKNIGHLQEEDVRDETGIFQEFINQCRISNLNDTEMREYKKSIMEYADVQDACVAAMEDGFAAGEAQGEAKGEARGEARGKTLGRMAGIAEAKRTMAIEMLKKGIPLALVSEITGLSEAELPS